SPVSAVPLSVLIRGLPGAGSASAARRRGRGGRSQRRPRPCRERLCRSGLFCRSTRPSGRGDPVVRGAARIGLRQAPSRREPICRPFPGPPSPLAICSGGMARRTVGPRRSDSPRTHARSTRIIGGLSVLALSGAIVWDLINDEFWFRHTLFTALVASLIVVAVTAAVLNEVLERRRR